MDTVSSLSDSDLLSRMPALVRTERGATAEVILHLIEIESRRLYLDRSCSSLYSYCKELLGYSEDEALKRVRVTRLAARLPQVLEELKSCQIHLTGLFVLAQHLTAENADAMLSEARGKSRREIEIIVARARPRPDAPDRVEALPSSLPGLSLTIGATSSGDSEARNLRPKVEPLSATSYRVEFTAGEGLREKIDRAKELLSHVLPGGDLAALVERALDALIERETRRRQGAGKPRKQRALRPGSRHVPRDVARIVWQRDGEQCTYVDDQGRRCGERKYLTIEHDTPHACGGLATPENLRLLCAAHNAHTARKVFGEARIAEKRAERDQASEVQAKVVRALVHSGFREREAKRALQQVSSSVAQEFEPLIRAALKALVPGAVHVRDPSASAFVVGFHASGYLSRTGSRASPACAVSNPPSARLATVTPGSMDEYRRVLFPFE